MFRFVRLSLSSKWLTPMLHEFSGIRKADLPDCVAELNNNPPAICHPRAAPLHKAPPTETPWIRAGYRNIPTDEDSLFSQVWHRASGPRLETELRNMKPREGVTCSRLGRVYAGTRGGRGYLEGTSRVPARQQQVDHPQSQR